MKKTILFYGAGAINRGYMPWVFPPDEYDYYFVDTNRDLMEGVARGYTTYRTLNDEKYESRKVQPLKDMPSHPTTVVISVGPRNTLSLADRFMKTDVPIIIAENDSRLPQHFAQITGNPNVVFCIPDVITSNEAGPLTEKGKHHVITETGTCYIEQRVSYLGGNVTYLDAHDLRTEFIRKMYLHNTPHCIVAYMGYLSGHRYIHEAMDTQKAQLIVPHVMHECIAMIHAMYGVDRDASSKYAVKEIARFANPLLYDPISRVAREPLRKLAQSERLVGAAALCLQAGITPTGILEGIKAACKYHHPLDPDYITMQYSRRMSLFQFLSFIGIGESEAIMQWIKETT